MGDMSVWSLSAWCPVCLLLTDICLVRCLTDIRVLHTLRAWRLSKPAKRIEWCSELEPCAL